MSISITFNSAHRISLASEFFMARRPVVDRSQDLVAHELLFCTAAAEGEACMTTIADDQPASASVIADVYQHGMGRVIGDRIGILHIDAGALMSDVFQFLPPENLMLELAGMRGVSTEVLDRLTQLGKAGFRFALAADDDGGDLDLDLNALLPHIETVRIDITGKEDADLQRCCSRFKADGKNLLAEKVETIEQFRRCADLGFDLFQGYFFTRPQILEGKKLSPSQIAITELMALLASDADDSVIELSIKGDVSLGLNLLRLVNTPAISAHRIDSLRQAMMVLGRNQLQRWLQVMLYAEPGVHGASIMALTAQATMRGRLMELVSQKARPGNRSIADTAFTVGIMSLMDTLFSMSMETILQQIPVVDEVRNALLHRQGYFGKLLDMVEHTEWREETDALLLPAIRDLKLSYNDLYLLQLAAFEWSDHVTRSIH